MTPLVRLRAAFRLARFGLHLGWGMATAGCAYPVLPRGPRLALKRRWSRQLLAILGVRLERTGGGPIRGLIVANHVSWLDIFVINAVEPAAFVCKAEVRRWPVIGWLCARTETIFLERGNPRAAQRTAETLQRCLEANRRVAVFPEGTTSEGGTVLPFHAALLQPAIDAGVSVAPLALSYWDDSGKLCAAPAYAGETTFGACLLAIVSEARIRARLHAAPELAAAGRTRRELAAAAHARIKASVEFPPARRRPGTPPVPAGAPPSDGHPTDSLNPAPAGSAPA